MYLIRENNRLQTIEISIEYQEKAILLQKNADTTTLSALQTKDSQYVRGTVSPARQIPLKTTVTGYPVRVPYLFPAIICIFPNRITYL